MAYKVITDSCSDLDREIRASLDVEYVKMEINADGKEYLAGLDWEDYSVKELYDWMRKGIRVYTSQVTRIEFEKEFDKYLSAGYDVLYIGCSSALSASVQLSKVVAEEMMKKYEGRKVVCIDSLNSCLGEGLLVVKAAEMRNEGKTLEETAEYIEQNKLYVNQFATVESLEYLKRAGRIKASKAFFGNLFGVKPIIISDAKGANFAYKKVKGRKASIAELVDSVKAYGQDIENQIIYICHADSSDDFQILKDEIEKNIKCKGVYCNYIGPIIGASTGPGTLSVFFVGKKVEIIGD